MVNKISEMFEDFEKELNELDIINPILCHLCDKGIPRTKMGEGYSIGELGFEMHVTCGKKLPNKEALLKPLDVLTEGLNQVNKMIVKITPIGVFSIGAGVVSTLSWSDLSRLQGYLLVYLLAVILFTFIVLPYIISIFTPYSSKTIFKITRSTLITIFATGKIIVVYPQLIEIIKEDLTY